MQSTYSSFVLDRMQLILTQIDRDEDSPTYGCCDRNHWHLKIRDFASAILQQSSLTLAMAYATDFEGNIYFKNKNIFKWAKAAIEFWRSIQLKDGSFNEYYPNEHGFPPTAFSLFAVARSYQILAINDDRIVYAIKKAADWLCRHIETKALNQEMASIAALYASYQIIPEKWILDGLEKKLALLLSRQSSEGWFPEYGGADFGYQSVNLDMMAEYYTMSGDERVFKPMERVTAFLSYFCHPDGTAGGEYGSRNTNYFLPAGFEILINSGNRAARSIKANLFYNVCDLNCQNAIDERYLAHYCMHSYLRAIRYEKIKIDEAEYLQLPCWKEEPAFFPECGLIAYASPLYYAIISLSKGGMIKVFSKENRKEIFNDFGYRIKNKKYLLATNLLNSRYKYSFSENKAEVRGDFVKAVPKTPTPLTHISLRMLSSLFGPKITSILKKKLILIDKESDVFFSRSIELNEDEITIKDHVTSKKVQPNLSSANNFSMRLVASGKFFSGTDLITDKLYTVDAFKDIRLQTKFSVKTGKVSAKIK